MVSQSRQKRKICLVQKSEKKKKKKKIKMQKVQNIVKCRRVYFM